MADPITTKLFGFKILEQNLAEVEAAALAVVPAAVEEASKIPIAMMKKLVPKKTGKLMNSIRFSFGKGAGAPRTSKAPSGRGSRGEGKTRVVGYLIAGDKTTIVGSNAIQRKRKNKGNPAKFQNAFIQEFGTQTRKAHPFFLPAWRATRRHHPLVRLATMAPAKGAAAMSPKA